jgi:hypothetical protein
MATAPLHILFSAAGAGALRQALASTRRTDEVICLDDNLSLGPIETFNPEVRMRWLATACRMNIDDWSWLPTAALTFWSRASSRTHRPIVWFTRNSAKEFAGFAAYLDQLGDRPFTAVDGTDIRIWVKHEAGQAEKTIMSLGELSPDRMQALIDTDRPIGALQLQKFGDIWATLQKDGALLRVVNGDELTSVRIDFFDHALLAACTVEWQRAVRVIATAMFTQVAGRLHMVDEMLLCARMVELLERGRLETREDTDGWPGDRVMREAHLRLVKV